MIRLALAAAFSIFILLVITNNSTGYETDATDPPDGKSGFGLYTDYGTGCQYLVIHWGFAPAITPRMNAEGKQVCE